MCHTSFILFQSSFVSILDTLNFLHHQNCIPCWRFLHSLIDGISCLSLIFSDCVTSVFVHDFEFAVCHFFRHCACDAHFLRFYSQDDVFKPSCSTQCICTKFLLRTDSTCLVGKKDLKLSDVLGVNCPSYFLRDFILEESTWLDYFSAVSFSDSLHCTWTDML